MSHLSLSSWLEARPLCSVAVGVSVVVVVVVVAAVVVVVFVAAVAPSSHS